MRKNLKVALLVQLVVSGAPLMADLFVPQFAEMLGATRFQIGVLGSVFALSMFASAAIFGRLSDRIGRKRILLLGFLASGTTYALSFFMQQFSAFFLLRVFQGISVGIYPGVLAAFISDSSGTMEDFAAFGSLGIATFIFLAGIVAGVSSVRWIFIATAFFYLISILLALRFEEKNVLPVEVPLFPLDIMKRNIFIYTAIFLTFSGITITWTYWVLYLKVVHTSQFGVGYITMINPLTEFLVLTLFAKRLRVRNPRIGMLILALSFPFFAVAQNLLQVVIIQIVSGTGWGLMYAGALGEIIARNEEKGTASGLFQSSVSLGNIAGPFIGGVVILLFHSLRAVFVAAGIIIFLGFLVMSLDRVPQEECGENTQNY